MSKVVKRLIISEEDYTEIIGRCLVSLASTKNFNNNVYDYEERVLKPYKSIKHTYEKLYKKDILPKDIDIKSILTGFEKMLMAKNLPTEEINYEMSKILKSKTFN